MRASDIRSRVICVFRAAPSVCTPNNRCKGGPRTTFEPPDARGFHHSPVAGAPDWVGSFHGTAQLSTVAGRPAVEHGRPLGPRSGGDIPADKGHYSTDGHG